jgi:hypothetical protein
VKLNIDVDEKYIHRFDGWFEAESEIKDLGWEIGRNLEGADIAIQQSQVVLDRRSPSPVTRPTIIYERNASGSIPQKNRQLVKNPLVVGYAKETGLRDKALYNAPTLHDRYHHTLLSDEPATPQDEIFEDHELDKIEVILQIFAHKDRYTRVRGRKTPKVRHRTADVFFSGVVTYDVDLITKHREDCCRILAGMSDHNVLLGIGRSLSPDTYAAALGDSKILVSPYGYGEYSWKDFEAVFAGCVVIKAESGFVQTHGFDVFKPGAHVVSCAPDFSDLKQVIDRVLSDINEAAVFAGAARAELEAAANEREQRAKDIVGFLNRSMARIR